MDGLEDLKNVILLAATNRPDMLDPALLRSGRFGRHIEVSMPDLESRKAIFKIHLKNKPLASDVNIEGLVKAFEGYTGADVQALCEEATLLTIRRSIPAFNEKRKEIQDYNIQLKQLQSEKASNKDIKELEEKIKHIRSQLVNEVVISKADFDEALEKILKGADRAKKIHDQYSKAPEELYK
jgi:transitional endoplasmic reticulum ATPase